MANVIIEINPEYKQKVENKLAEALPTNIQELKNVLEMLKNFTPSGKTAKIKSESLETFLNDEKNKVVNIFFNWGIGKGRLGGDFLKEDNKSLKDSLGNLGGDKTLKYLQNHASAALAVINEREEQERTRSAELARPAAEATTEQPLAGDLDGELTQLFTKTDFNP